MQQLNREAARLRQLNRAQALAKARAAAQLRRTQRQLTQIHDRFPTIGRSVTSIPDRPHPTSAPDPTTLDRFTERFAVVQQQQRAAEDAIYMPDARTRAAGQIMRLSTLLADPNTRRRTLAGMSAANLRTLLFDPEFGTFHAMSNAHVRIVQGYLRAHGYEGVRVDGVFDQATLNGLSAEMEALARRERAEAILSLRDTFIDTPYDLDLAGLPGLRGDQNITATDLFRILSRDDPVAARLLRALYQRLSVRQLGALRARMLKANVTEKIELQMSRELMFQAQREAEESSWFAMAVKPFDYLSDVTRASIVQLWDTIKNPERIWQDFDDEEREKNLREDAAKVALFDYDHRWWGLITSMLADPTILIPGRVFIAPFRLAGRGVWTGSHLLESAGFKLSSTGRIVSLPLNPVAAALRAPAVALRAPGKALAHVADDAAEHGTAARRARDIAHLTTIATRTLGQTRRAAQLRAAGALRRGITATGVRGLPEGALGLKVPKTFMREMRQLADEHDAAMAKLNTVAHDPAPDIIDTLVENRLSLYSHANREGPLSDVGAILDANLAASVRLQAVEQLARERARAAIGQMSTRATDSAQEMRAAYEKVFEETMEGAGPYVLGYGDPELVAILDARVNFRLESIRESWFVAVQNRIELALDDLGETLWDEKTLRFKGARGDVSEVMRKLGAEMFDDARFIDVPNPLHGRFFKLQDARRYASAELRIRSAQKSAWFARRKAAGDSPGKNWLEDEVAAIKDDVQKAWVRVKEGEFKGYYTDQREFLSVAPAYARQYDQIRKLKAFRGAKEDPFTLEDLARSPGERVTELRPAEFDLGFMPAQVQIDRVAAFFRFKRPPDEAVDQFIPLADDLTDDIADAVRMPWETEERAMVEFQNALITYDNARDAVWKAMYGSMLAREGALYSAMRYSQQKRIRYTWTAAEATLGLWRFMVLPLRMGWTVVNYIDNAVKALLLGAVSPKYWFRATKGGGEGFLRAANQAQSVFELGWSEIRQVVRFLDGLFGTSMERVLDDAFTHFWQLPTAAHQRLFHLHGFEFPEEWLLKQAAYGSEGSRVLKRVEDLAAMAARGEDVTRLDRAQAQLTRFQDSVWDLFGNRPENFARRALYYRTYDDAIKQGDGLLTATEKAWAKVEEGLFDYSQISTFEDNLRFMFPFIQWARKNNSFWLRQMARRPGLTMGVMDSYGEFRDQVNADLPDWMRRYFGLKWASDLVSRVPGLDWMVGPLADSVTDPVNFLSVKNLYRIFKQENPELPEDDSGWRFVSGFVDALGEVGFTMNPLVRKPLELSGVLTLRSWQTIFPQTSLVEAFTREFWNDRFPNGLNIERMLQDKVLEAMGKETTADAAADNFDRYVQMEMAAQAYRGETVNRHTAERKISDFLLVQTLVGYFAGVYLRRLTPEDIFFSQLADAMRRESEIPGSGIEFLDLSPRERSLYRLWQRRGDRVQFDYYLEQLPLVEAFYRIPDYVQSRKFLNDHLEIAPFVEETYGRRVAGQSPGYVARNLLLEKTDIALSLFDLVDKLDLSPETARLAENLLVTSELRRFWSLNDTPADRRETMLRGLFFREMNELNKAYHAIPEDDFAAREGYLQEHPQLLRFWNSNNTGADDFKLIIQSSLGDLRDRYFEFVEAGDWDAANAFLDAFPFTFDHFDETGKFVRDRQTGRPDPKTMSQHARDYQRARRWLDHFFSLPESMRDEWLNGSSEGAMIVRWYFDRYASRRGGASGGSTQHARDYLVAREWLDHYFSLPKSERNDWLHGSSKGAAVVLDYFKKYGRMARVERSFREMLDDSPLLRTHNAELRRRLTFWRRYFALTPDQRPLFVMRNAEKYGVFVYGLLGDVQRHDREQAWLRRALSVQGMSNRAAHYLYVKPLLDYFFKLKGKDEKRLFLRANPEVQEYLDNFSRKSPTGDPRLDKLVEAYFKLPDDSQARSLFLRQHPEVQDYFDEKATPAERAMRNLLEVYFEIDYPPDRERFLQRHPEIQDYFDKRQRERANEKEQLEAFDQADPRLRPFFDLAGQDIGESAERMRERLLSSRRPGLGLGLEVRRGRDV